MTLTTTHIIEGNQVSNYFDVITGEVILGANTLKDIFAGIRDIVGGRSTSYERELREARRIGANVIIGIDIDYETIGANSSMLMVSVSGTAVSAS